MAPARRPASNLTAKQEGDGSLVVYAKVGKASVPVATVPANIVRHHLDDVPAGDTGDDNDNDNDNDEGGS